MNHVHYDSKNNESDQVKESFLLLSRKLTLNGYIFSEIRLKHVVDLSNRVVQSVQVPHEEH
jgi:hypothetical protein